MAIDRKAKKPVVDGLKLRFVRFSGHALTQGVDNTKIDGVPGRRGCNALELLTDMRPGHLQYASQEEDICNPGRELGGTNQKDAIS